MKIHCIWHFEKREIKVKYNFRLLFEPLNYETEGEGRMRIKKSFHVCLFINESDLNRFLGHRDIFQYK